MKVGIVYPHANIDTVPSLVGAAELLAGSGYDVDLYTYLQAGQPAPRFGSPQIRLCSLGVDGLADHSTAGLRRMVKRAGWLPGVARAPLALGYQALGAGLERGSRFAARARGVLTEARIAVLAGDGRRERTDLSSAAAARGSGPDPQSEPYVCVIGVDPDGLELAHSLAHGAPLAYYSLELLLSYELSTPTDLKLKARERELSREAAFVVVQDEGRGRLLADDNGLAWDRVVLVPNAPPGPPRRQASRFWHSHFGLPEDARVVIHSGSLGDWTGIEDIVASASDWPPPWVLVIHTRYDAESSSYVDALRTRAGQGRVWFSLKPVPRQDYDALIDGADVGLAFYVSSDASSFTQRNIQTIGLSSGKLAYYLRAGLPVIINSDASIAASIDAARCGVTVSGASGIAAALERISLDYDAFSGRALGYFEERLDFGRAFADVIRRVDALR